MLRLTITLIVALWAVFVIWGAPERAPQPAITEERDVPQPVRTARTETYSIPTLISGDKAIPFPEVTATRAAPAPLLSTERPGAGPSGTPLGAEPDVALEPDAEPVRVVVIGNRVNLRAGPSTENPVVGALSLGEIAEVLGPEVGGWVEIRDPESGLRGFMAARFLEAL